MPLGHRLCIFCGLWYRELHYITSFLTKIAGFTILWYLWAAPSASHYNQKPLAIFCNQFYTVHISHAFLSQAPQSQRSSQLWQCSWVLPALTAYQSQQHPWCLWLKICKSDHKSCIRARLTPRTLFRLIDWSLGKEPKIWEYLWAGGLCIAWWKQSREDRQLQHVISLPVNNR